MHESSWRQGLSTALMLAVGMEICCSGLIAKDYGASGVVEEAVCEHSFNSRSGLEQKPSPIVEPKPSASADPVFNPFRRIYFSYFPLLGHGHLNDVIDQLDALQSMGITDLWINPVHPQTVSIWPAWSENTWNNPQQPPPANRSWTVNHHRYWPSDHASVDEDIGGWDTYKRLIAEAKKRGIHIVLDAVTDHFGYLPPGQDSYAVTYTLENGEVVHDVFNSKDVPALFRGNFNEQKLNALFVELENAPNFPEIYRILELIEKEQWCGSTLPVVNHGSERLYKYFFNSYRAFVDAGQDRMRLDAFKHLPLRFAARLAEDLAAYSLRKYNRKMAFLAEFLYFPPQRSPGSITSFSYLPLNAVAYYMAQHVPSAPIYFIDFPGSNQVRELAFNPAYGFNHYAHFIDARDNPVNRNFTGFFVADLENHDHQTPIHDEKYPENRLISFAASDFFTLQPTIIFHGGEQLNRPGEARRYYDKIDANGYVAKMLQKFNEALEPARSSSQFAKTKFHVADHNTMIAEKTIGDDTFILVLQRGSGHHHFHVHLDREVREVVQGTPELELVVNTNEDDATNGKIDIHLGQDRKLLRMSVEGPMVVLLKFKKKS